MRAVTWYVVLDESRATPARGRDYVDGFELAKTVIGRYLPDAQLTTPTVSLGKFVGRQAVLTTLLLGFNVPALGFLLYFLVVTSAVVAYWQRRETAIMISRGMTRWGVLSYTLVEGLVLFLIGLPVGLGLGMVLARLMGYTTSFLDFETRIALPVSLNGINLPLIGATLGILLIAKLWTAAATSGETVLTQQRETRARRVGHSGIVPTWICSCSFLLSTVISSCSSAVRWAHWSKIARKSSIRTHYLWSCRRSLLW
ncbi:MAG: ABC transporter permease [Caldilineaceae bacterium]